CPGPFFCTLQRPFDWYNTSSKIQGGPAMGTWKPTIQLAAYKQQLLHAGFQEAALGQSTTLGLFYKPCTEQTAFVVDLLGTAHWLEVVYGVASTAFTRLKGNEDSLAKMGIS